MSSEGRVALVTGSSRGLGAAIARDLARHGYRVAVNGVDADETEAVVDDITEAGGDALSAPGDITEEGGVAEVVGRTLADLGPVEVLVLNATGPQPEAPLVDVDWADHKAQLDFFVKSPVLVGAEVVPGMIERRFGRIVNIDSDVAERPPPQRSAYATAKSAQVGLTRAWAAELAPHGITVNTIAPGFIPVERHLHIDKSGYLAGVPVGRMGTPADVAQAVRYFVADGAGFVTGQRLLIDGGRSLNN